MSRSAIFASTVIFRRIMTLVVLPLFFGSCMKDDSIVFRKISNLRFEKNGSATNLVADVVLENTSSFQCKVISTEARILIDNVELGRAELLESKKLEARTTQQWPCRLDIKSDNLLKALPSGLGLFVGDKKIPAQVNGTVKARIFFFTKSYSFNVRQDLDAKFLGSMF